MGLAWSSPRYVDGDTVANILPAPGLLRGLNDACVGACFGTVPPHRPCFELSIMLYQLVSIHQAANSTNPHSSSIRRTFVRSPNAAFHADDDRFCRIVPPRLCAVSVSLHSRTVRSSTFSDDQHWLSVSDCFEHVVGACVSRLQNRGLSGVSVVS